MVALQLVYLDQDVSRVYSNPNPAYRNYTIDFERLNKMIDSILDQRVRQSIAILTSMDSKKRMGIFELLRNIPIDENKVSLLNPE
jgi:Cys-tRNA synthase (O-phospho-L-seryl-tRNA:Cys-tRNA synthase)